MPKVRPLDGTLSHLNPASSLPTATPQGGWSPAVLPHASPCQANDLLQSWPCRCWMTSPGPSWPWSKTARSAAGVVCAFAGVLPGASQAIHRRRPGALRDPHAAQL